MAEAGVCDCARRNLTITRGGGVMVVEIITFLFSIGAWFFGGFTFMTLWSWFVAPTFGIVTLNYAQALGICLFLTFFKAKHIDNDNDGSDEYKLKVTLTPVAFCILYGLLLGI